jgi:hypothetical protein
VLENTEEKEIINAKWCMGELPRRLGEQTTLVLVWPSYLLRHLSQCSEALSSSFLYTQNQYSKLSWLFENFCDDLNSSWYVQVNLVQSHLQAKIIY